MYVGDKIRNMSDEELLDFLLNDGDFIHTRCKVCKYNRGCTMTEKECVEGVMLGLRYDEDKDYVPLCPIGYTDCICDPAYIKYYHPEWYKELHGDKSPEEVVKETCCKKIIKLNEPLETSICPDYDDEDK